MSLSAYLIFSHAWSPPPEETELGKLWRGRFLFFSPLATTLIQPGRRHARPSQSWLTSQLSRVLTKQRPCYDTNLLPSLQDQEACCAKTNKPHFCPISLSAQKRERGRFGLDRSRRTTLIQAPRERKKGKKKTFFSSPNKQTKNCLLWGATRLGQQGNSWMVERRRRRKREKKRRANCLPAMDSLLFLLVRCRSSSSSSKPPCNFVRPWEKGESFRDAKFGLIRALAVYEAGYKLEKYLLTDVGAEQQTRLWLMAAALAPTCSSGLLGLDKNNSTRNEGQQTILTSSLLFRTEKRSMLKLSFERHLDMNTNNN